MPHDAWLVAVAQGSGVTAPHWPIARPYQPSSPQWKPYVLAVTGAVRLDRDGDGHFSSANGYAKQAIERAGIDRAKLLSELAVYDEPTSTQAASLLRLEGVDLASAEMISSLKSRVARRPAWFPGLYRGLAAEPRRSSGATAWQMTVSTRGLCRWCRIAVTLPAR